MKYITMAKEKIGSIDELKYDEHNFNKHTDEGLKLLEKSVEQNKFGRSILVDKDNNIIAGNGIVETARKLGKTKIRVVETSGDELVVVKRNDLHIDSKEGRELALADNATAAANLQWNEEELAFAKENWGVQPDDWGVDIDFTENKKETKDLSDDFLNSYRIEIICDDESTQENLYNEMTERGYVCRVLTL